MTDTAAIIDLLNKSNLAFSQASEIGLELSRQLHQLTRTPLDQSDREQRQQWLIKRSPQLNQLRACLRDLRGVAQQLPDGFAGVAERLRRIARVVLYLYETAGTAEPDKRLKVLHYLHTVGERGRNLASEARLQLDVGWSRAIPPAPSTTLDPVSSDEANALALEPTANCSMSQGVGKGPGDPAFDAAGEARSDEKEALTSNGVAGGGRQATKLQEFGEDQSLLNLLGIYTNGVTDDRIKQAKAALQTPNLTAHDKLMAIHQALPIPPTASARQLGKVLDVTASAVKKTNWWKSNRNGKRSEAVDERRERMAQRGEAHETISTALDG